MNSIALRIGSVAAVAMLGLGWILGLQTASTHPHTAVTATRLYTGADGLTHTEQIEVKSATVPRGPSTAEQSQPVKVTDAYVVRLAPGYFEGWHNADKRRYVVTLSGRAEIEVANRQKLSIGPGQLALAEDLTGKGHTFRVTGTGDWVALFVEFAQQ